LEQSHHKILRLLILGRGSKKKKKKKKKDKKQKKRKRQALQKTRRASLLTSDIEKGYDLLPKGIHYGFEVQPAHTKNKFKLIFKKFSPKHAFFRSPHAHFSLERTWLTEAFPFPTEKEKETQKEKKKRKKQKQKKISNYFVDVPEFLIFLLFLFFFFFSFFVHPKFCKMLCLC